MSVNADGIGQSAFPTLRTNALKWLRQDRCGRCGRKYRLPNDVGKNRPGFVNGPAKSSPRRCALTPIATHLPPSDIGDGGSVNNGIGPRQSLGGQKSADRNRNHANPWQPAGKVAQSPRKSRERAYCSSMMMSNPQIIIEQFCVAQCGANHRELGWTRTSHRFDRHRRTYRDNRINPMGRASADADDESPNIRSAIRGDNGFSTP
jgi:hypothetical protein